MVWNKVSSTLFNLTKHQKIEWLVYYWSSQHCPKFNFNHQKLKTWATCTTEQWRAKCIWQDFNNMNKDENNFWGMFNFIMKNLAQNAVQDTQQFSWLPTLWNKWAGAQTAPSRSCFRNLAQFDSLCLMAI